MASFMTSSKLAGLLRAADPHGVMYARLVENGIAVGPDPLHPTNVIDFAHEAIIPYASKNSVEGLVIADNREQMHSPKIQRRSGEYWFELRGKRVECGSLKELLAEGLKAIERFKPGMLDTLSLIKPRSRRIVARDPAHLFEKPHLAREFAGELENGWFYGMNNSARETGVWLKRAAECAGLVWGTDFITSTDSIDAL